MIELLAEITEIPFEIFYSKYLEKGGLDLYESRAGAVWFRMAERQRIKAFERICNEVFITDLAHEILDDETNR